MDQGKGGNLIDDIFIFAGIDLVVRRFNNTKKWEIKENECSRCGNCCSMMTGKSFPFSTPYGCKYLGEGKGERLCALGYYRPNGCAVGELDLEGCTVRWRVVE
jgi:hypothetical protein